MNNKILESWENLQKASDGILSVIRDEEHYERVHQLLSDALNSLPVNESLIDYLSDLLEDYDRKNPIEYASPSEMIQYYMEEKGISQTELSQEIGIDQSIISKHLRREREINLSHAKKYSAYFEVPIEVFLGHLGSINTSNLTQMNSPSVFHT